jgi:serine protease inhibitor
MALSMTQLGARGSTASDMSTSLHLPSDATISSTGFKQLTEALQV